LRVTIHDISAVTGLKPLDVSAYLKASGWRQHEQYDRDASLWLRSQPPEAELLLPLRQELADFPLRMSEVLRILAEVENRSELDVIRDLATATSDLIRVRSLGPLTDNGTLPLEQAVSLVEHSRNLVLAAACAAIEKRTYYAKRKPDQAMEYLGRVRMGQTEQGSYVLTILSPVPPELKTEQTAFPFAVQDLEPFERQVTRTMFEALRSMSLAAAEAATTGNMEPSRTSVSSGVSAILCEAVVGAAQISSGVDVAVTWARSRPILWRLGKKLIPEGQEHITIGGDYAEVIAEAARIFRASTPVEDFELDGFVVRLHRGPRAKTGDVTIVCAVEGHLRNVTVELGGQAYSDAVRAHDRRIVVTCIGDLSQEGRSFRLRNPRHFQLRLAPSD
jgi:hypothetical protein